MYCHNRQHRRKIRSREKRRERQRELEEDERERVAELEEIEQRRIEEERYVLIIIYFKSAQFQNGWSFADQIHKSFSASFFARF